MFFPSMSYYVVSVPEGANEFNGNSTELTGELLQIAHGLVLSGRRVLEHGGCLYFRLDGEGQRVFRVYWDSNEGRAKMVRTAWHDYYRRPYPSTIWVEPVGGWDFLEAALQT